MATLAQIVPLLVFALIAGLIGARLLGNRRGFAMPKPRMPKRARRLRIVPKEQMDRDLNDLLRRK